MAANQAPYDAQASTNYKEAFALFDKRGNQRVQVESLGDLLRACGQNPTLSEIRDLEKNVGGDCMFFFPPASLLPPVPHAITASCKRLVSTPQHFIAERTRNAANIFCSPF